MALDVFYSLHTELLTDLILFYLCVTYLILFHLYDNLWGSVPGQMNKRRPGMLSDLPQGLSCSSRPVGSG